MLRYDKGEQVKRREEKLVLVVEQEVEEAVEVEVEVEELMDSSNGILLFPVP